MPQATIDHLDHMFNALDAAIKQDPDGDPVARMAATMACGIMRILVKDIHRIADAQEIMAGTGPHAPRYADGTLKR